MRTADGRSVLALLAKRQASSLAHVDDLAPHRSERDYRDKLSTTLRRKNCVVSVSQPRLPEGASNKAEFRAA